MSMEHVGSLERSSNERVRYVPAVGPRLRMLLLVVFGLLAVLGVNSVYLVTITILERITTRSLQNYFYQYMFLAHLVLGLVIILPIIAFGMIHMANARHRPNQRAVRAGYALFVASLIVLGSGVVLTRFEAMGHVLAVRNPQVRNLAYWFHVATPLVCVWLFVLHRLAGPRIQWRVGARWLTVAGAFAVVMVVLHSHDPRQWNVAGPASGEQYFFPSLARTATGNFIPARALMNDQYCLQCHADTHRQWAHGVHRFSSFNNPPYEATVLETRRAMFERDGNVQGSRFCAGCHDPVPFFSGEFEDPRFDDPAYDLATDPMANAGVTCTVCHAITNINTVRGNADYTIEEPTHYPFAFSDQPVLRWINRQLVKAKPDFHKKTFLKPLHKTPEFCGTCHKVHLPETLNAYKFLRGQNHYDAYQLSGVSGHGVTSFYYPKKATHNCSECHMPLMASEDFGARFFEQDAGSELFGRLSVHDHQFPAANTGIPHLLGMPDWVNEAHREFLDGVMRVDIFGLKAGGTIAGALEAPIRPDVPALRPGGLYLLETVIRTVKMGHLFTQGTADSNEVWMDVRVTCGDRVIGRSGGLAADGEVDPWSHFVNAFVLDRDGNRIDRRNAQDIFVALYNHQIPPGAGDVVHYKLRVPPDVTDPITVEVELRYRKFDTTYMKFFQGDAFVTNDLPITTLATDRVTFPIVGMPSSPANSSSPVTAWERWNDYGIGLLRKGSSGTDKGELRQADAAFAQVEKLGRPDGPLNRTRVYLKEGRLTDAVSALQRAAAHVPAAPAWSVAWFTGLVNKQNGFLDEAIDNFNSLVEMDTQETRRREFDFAQDYRLLNELGQTILERAKQERGDDRQEARGRLLDTAAAWFQRSLELDPENVAAHFNLGLIHAMLGDSTQAEHHRALHAKYKPDDNARDRAVAAARKRYPAADHAAEAIVIYDLQRRGAFELPPGATRMALHD